MRIYRFQNNNKTFWGVASEADTQDLKYISGSIYEKWNIDAKVNKESDFRILLAGYLSVNLSRYFCGVPSSKTMILKSLS